MLSVAASTGYSGPDPPAKRVCDIWRRAHLLARCSSLKMCTVSVLLEAQRNCESILKARELMVTYLEHRACVDRRARKKPAS